MTDEMMGLRALIETALGRRPAARDDRLCRAAQNDAEAAKSQWRKVADQLRPTLPRLAALPRRAGAGVPAGPD